jgi:hypothetical protein
VIEVIPENNAMKWLDNMGIIDHIQSIKRVKIFVNGTIIDNPNPTWRYLEEFYLIPGKLNTEKKYQKSVLGQHVGNLMKWLKRQSMEFAKDLEMPQDLICLPCSDGSR